ncbi:MAG: 3',5'-cyclic-nucleotide phosphodiesterase [Pirellulales bacterium]
MRIRLVNSAVGGGSKEQFTVSFIVNDSIAIDAGCIGFLAPIEEQKCIKHVFLSHSHIDHIGSLPIFLDNVYEQGPQCPVVYGSQDVLNCIRDHFFNDTVWPDLERVSHDESPFLRMVTLEPERPIEIGELTITPVPLSHVVPTMGFVLDDGDAAVAIVCDTCSTEEIWSVINTTEDLQAVFLEASFPGFMKWLADKSMHLTPEMLKSETKKLKKNVRIIAIHIKAAFRDAIIEELDELGLSNLEIGQADRVYEI